MTIRQRIISFLQNHPEGIDDDECSKVLKLSTRQQANQRCRELEKPGPGDTTVLIRLPIDRQAKKE